LAEEIPAIKDSTVWIDHHLAMEKPPGRCHIYSGDATSTVEIVLDIIDQTLGVDRLDRDLLIMALAAIYVETRFLQLATPKTLCRIAKLMELTGLTIRDIYAKLPKEESVSSHHNKVSRQLLAIGGDVAIVYGYKKRGKIHIRATDGRGEVVRRGS